MNSTNCDALNAPLSLSALIDGGACFDIDANFDSIYDETHISDNDDDDTNNEEIQEILISPWQAPFDELRVQMERVDDNIYKKVINAGDQDGGKVPLQARVHCRYNAYWEGETAPFDSTYLRGSTFHFYTGRGEVLTGLECAVLSMCRGERSQFLISHKLLFGEMGCPPRVKPKAEGLFEIEVVSFNLVGNATADEELSQEERKKYAIVIDKVKQIHLKGLDFFGQGMYSNACRTFERAVAVLNMCHMANEQEELEQKIYLIKLYTNLAVCYVKLNKPKRTCLMCREINRLTQNNPSCKALFQEGRALLMLGEYERARAVLKRAYQMEPQNREIVNELNTLEKRFSAYKEDEKKIWSQALGVVRASRKEDKKSKDSQDEQFEKEMLEIMKSFKENVAINEFKLPSNLTESELSKMSTLAKSMDLIFKVSPTYNETLYTLNKPQTAETKVNDTEQADTTADK